jgi:hypothetical protein
MAARVSIRKMGTRQGHPHYGATCETCGTVLVAAHATRETCVTARETHRRDGCAVTLRAAHNVIRDGAHFRSPFAGDAR